MSSIATGMNCESQSNKNQLRKYRRTVSKETNVTEKSKNPKLCIVKKCLDDCLGDVILGLIPGDELARLKYELGGGVIPAKFEVTMKNLLLNNIKLTRASDDDDTALQINTILRIGEYLKEQVLIKRQDVLNEELAAKQEHLCKSRREKVEEELLKITADEDRRFKADVASIVEKHNKDLSEAKASVEKSVEKEYAVKLSKQAAKIMRKMSEKAKIFMLLEREKELREEFQYRMKLDRTELFEEFLDEKAECELKWANMLTTLKENNCREIKHLRVSLEAEHAQNLTELELWYEVQCRKVPENGNAEQNQNYVNELSYFNKLRDMDVKLLEKNKILSVYKRRLKYILNSYMEFMTSSFQKNSTMLRKQLNQSKLLMAKVNEIEIEIPEYYKNQPTLYANKTPCTSRRKKF